GFARGDRRQAERTEQNEQLPQSQSTSSCDKVCGHRFCPQELSFLFPLKQRVDHYGSDVVGSPFHLSNPGLSSTSKINTIYSGRPHRDKRYCIQHFRSTDNELFETGNSKQPIV